MKVNFDSGVIGSDAYQTAAVARDSNGRCVGWAARWLRGSQALVEAEASAARFAIFMALERGWTHIHLEGDYLQVVNALNDGVTHVISASLVFSSCFSAFLCSFVSVRATVLSHAFAHFPISDYCVLEGVILPAYLARLI